MMISISDASAPEQENYLIFDVSLLDALPPEQSLTLALEAVGITAREGPTAGFSANVDNPFDFANREFEFSLNNSGIWQQAENSNQVSFSSGTSNLRVRLPINDDELNEGLTPETLELRVADVILGSIDNPTEAGTGSIIDNDVPPPINVVISDAIASEGEDEYAVFNVGLTSSSGLRTLLRLGIGRGSATPGPRASLGNPEGSGSDDVPGSSIDYADDEFEVSTDRGATWEIVRDGVVEIPQGFIDITQVRVPIADDQDIEDSETFELFVEEVVQGELDSISDIGTATIIDNDFLINDNSNISGYK